jgi:hypothetical protein
MNRSSSDEEEGTMPLPPSIKTGIQDGLVALSLANLCLVNAWSNPLAAAAHGYFNQVPLSPTIFRALLTSTFSLALVAWLVMRVRRRFRSRRCAWSLTSSSSFSCWFRWIMCERSY